MAACDDQTDPRDFYGRVWRNCESGLSLTKASMGRFIMFVLRNNVEIGDLYVFDPKFHGSRVLASLRLRPDQFEAFEQETGGKLRKPAKIDLNTNSGSDDY